MESQENLHASVQDVRSHDESLLRQEHLPEEPVFDGTEEQDREAQSTIDAGNILNRDASGVEWKTFGRALDMTDWPEKAATVRNFVKERGVQVSNVLRKISAKIEDLDRDVFEKGLEAIQRFPFSQENDFRPPQTLRNTIPTSTPTSSVDVDIASAKVKGRITFFSTSGCEDCRAVRHLLRKKGLPYVEINVDVYPNRKLELEERTGTSSLPQVFFNEAFIGGIVELKAMETSRELDERLKQVFENECPATAPLPPVTPDDDEPPMGNTDEMAEIAENLMERVAIKDRFYKMRWFSKCFVGSEAIDILAEENKCERSEAVEIGRKLAKKFFLKHILQENVFEDGNNFYRFLEHDPLILAKCYNFKGRLNELEPKPAQELEIGVRKIAQALFEQYTTEDGKQVNYQGILSSEQFKRYLNLAQQLQRIDLLELSKEENLAFFINLYNIMVVHAVLIFGHPSGAIDRRKFFGDFQYLIGGSTYSLSAIENGVLRGNQRPPYNLTKAFGPKDDRLKVSLLEFTPSVHFALARGTVSSPAIRCYTPSSIDAELRGATRLFFKDGGIEIDVGLKTVFLTPILKWYAGDFGRSELEILKWVVDYLEPTKAEELLELMEGEIKIVYQPYDWNPNV